MASFNSDFAMPLSSTGVTCKFFGGCAVVVGVALLGNCKVGKQLVEKQCVEFCFCD